MKKNSIIELFREKFSSKQKCIDYYEKVVWEGNPVSPFDPTSKVWKLANNQYMCKNTGKSFNIKTKTPAENSKIPLWKWFYVGYLISNHKKGISSSQLSKDLGITQKSAWFMLHRLRVSTDCSTFKTVLVGGIEIDETYLGGKNANRHWDKKVPNSQGRSYKDKTPVLVIVKRGGNVIAKIVPNVKRETLEPIIMKHVKKGSNVYTDEWHAYKDLGKWYNHEIVNHRKKQYVKDEVSVNSAESFNACLKRTIKGTHHWVSRKHLQKYVDEITFRYNTRKWGEQERFDLLLLSSIGKRLTYQQLIS